MGGGNQWKSREKIKDTYVRKKSRDEGEIKAMQDGYKRVEKEENIKRKGRNKKRMEWENESNV